MVGRMHVLTCFPALVELALFLRFRFHRHVPITTRLFDTQH
jgi:hypothetical protein